MEKTKKEKFIEKAKKVHGDKYDYSEVEYINNRTPIKIIDHEIDENGNEYGEFWQTPNNHLKGQGNPKKRGNKISLSKRSKEDDIIKRFKEVHKGENLDYSQVKYVNMHTKVKIISHDLREDGTEYGEFWQEPVVHLKGCSHPDIGKKKCKLSQRYTTEEFIERAKKVHGDKYDYSKVDYKSSQTKVCIICNKENKRGKKHGEFYVNPDAFLQGKGCPKCGYHLSNNEDEIYEYIKNNITCKIERNNRTVLDGKEIDIYIPDKKIGIEYNGLNWHKESDRIDRYYHLNKTIEASKKCVTLIHIFEDEFLNNKNIVLDKLSIILGFKKFDKKIPGRKCIVKAINKNKAKDFLNKNHIQGFVSSSVYLGAYFNEELIAVMSFLKEKNDEWNLTRYSTNIDYSCQGVASKILKCFINQYNPKTIKSFLDRRWCFNENDNLYTKLGFVVESILKPDYRYYKHTETKQIRYHKFGFRKQILHKKYGFPLTMTETEMVKELGYDKIWDCGLIKYKLKLE